MNRLHGSTTKAARLVRLALLCVAVPMAAQGIAAPATAIPRDKNALLYYKIGGGESVARAAHPSTLAIKLGLGGVARANYSCGRFDAQVTIQNLMNKFATLGTTITAAVKSGIAALPMYILERAQPGLYELFQTYMAKAEKEWNIALKSCEQMETEIRAGKDPYEEYLQMAKGESWKTEAASGKDAVKAKENVESNNGWDGMTWIGGIKYGGASQKPIEPNRNVVEAGFQLTVNRAVTTPSTATVASPSSARLTRAFPTAKDAGDFAVQVLGDKSIALCDSPACPPKAVVAGTGLLPRIEAEVPNASAQLNALLTSTGVPMKSLLEDASAPGVVIGRELVDALRAMPPAQRAQFADRLSMEIAQARILDKALLVRGLLATGMTGVPEVARAGAAIPDLKTSVSDLNRLIDDTLFDLRARREMVSQTAATLIESYRNSQAESGALAPTQRSDANPLSGGRVTP